MSSVNKCIFVGNVVADPEVREAGAAHVCNFRLALNESYMRKDGKKVERVEFINVVAWNKLADICGQYLKKGRQVYVECAVQTESYEKNGERRYATKFVASSVHFIGQGDSEETQEDDTDTFF